MTVNSVMTHRNVGVLTVEAVEAPEVVTSDWIDEQLAETYERCGLRPARSPSWPASRSAAGGPRDVTFDEAAAMAGREAIEASGIDPDGSAC